jgi:riboflavin-specific deaminase-like protein
MRRPRFRRLLGDAPDDATAAELVEALPFGAWAPSGRPYLIINMVATLDGRVAVHGRAGPIGNQADRELFHHLRARGDAVLVGAGTARVERYGRLTRDDALRALRRRLGLAAEPAGVLVSRSLAIPTDLPLLNEPGREVVIVTESDATLPPVPANVRYVRAPVPEALRHLREQDGIAAIVCEGGPHLNASLLPTGLADELYICIAPTLAGGHTPLTLLEGPLLDPPLALELAWLLESGGYLFARYRVPPAAVHPA